MGLLSGTKRINRDGMGLLDINPYASNFVTAADPRYSDLAMVSNGDTGQTNQYDQWLSVAPGLSDSYWNNLGYNGPVSTQATENSGPQMAPELQQWIADRGYQVATDGGRGWNALADANGNYVAGSEYGNRTNDDAAFIAGALGLGIGGASAGGFGGTASASPTATAAANGALTGAATGTGLGGLGSAGYGGLAAGGTLYAANAADTVTDAGVNGGTSQRPPIPQGSPNVAPIESIPQVTAPELAQVSQVPQASTITAQQAASAAGAANAFKPSDNYGDGMSGSQTSAYDNTINATGNPELANAISGLTGSGQQFYDWLKANPQAAKALFGAIGAAGAVSGNKSGGSGYVDSGYRPTISRGGWQANVTPTYSKPQTQAPGLLNVPATGQQNDGLWRFGLLGK